jgi:hypothetical protein
MSTLDFTEDFENGTNGNSITTGTSSFDGFNGTGTRTFDNTVAATGTLSAKCVSTGVAGVYVQMVHTLPSTYSVLYMRFAVYITANPGANTPIASPNGTGVGAELRITTTGALQLRNNSTQVAITGASSIPLNTWFLVEWMVDSTNSVQQAKLYSGLTGTPIATTSAVLYNQGPLSNARFGITTTTAATVWLDTIATSPENWIGPLSDSAYPGWFRA